MIEINKVASMAHFFLDRTINEGDSVVDATAGNGYDTLYLAKKVGQSGTVYAFDIQKEALAVTAERLRKNNLADRVILIEAGHECMHNYLPEPASAIIYNLGYLPGGNHSVVTKHTSTMESFARALGLIKQGGLITITMYPGHDEGKLERDCLMTFCDSLAAPEYSAACFRLINRVNEPPELLVVQKRVSEKSSLS